MDDQSQQSSSHNPHGVGHVVPVRVLAITAFALLVLTIVTVWIASFEFGNLNIWVALAIAVFPANVYVALENVGLPDGAPGTGNAVVNWSLPAGSHVLEIARREDGTFLDAIAIVQ